jgi:tRNA-specific 2-thiouridylase
MTANTPRGERAAPASPVKQPVPERSRIVVAMSGGVDSSVAALLLHDAGFEVIGLSMQLYDQRGGDVTFGSCCTLDDLHDARRVAASLGIAHYIVNLERRFTETVVANFVGEYLAGRTPLPCAHCNSELKFAELVSRAQALGAETVATGHYARTERRADGRWRLLRGLDPRKDQSYFLFGLTQAQLARAVFPLGAMTKDEVRELARQRNLRVADKRDSQEICFVPNDDYAAVVERQAAGRTQPGDVVDLAGRTLGRHDGVHRFTIGQRKGLRLSSTSPLYVVAIDAPAGRVVVGPRAALERRTLTASGVNWIAGPPPEGEVSGAAQIRYRHPAGPARVRPLEGRRVEVEFDVPQAAVTPGQAVVFYDGDDVLGGGWIDGGNA